MHARYPRNFSKTNKEDFDELEVIAKSIPEYVSLVYDGSSYITIEVTGDKITHDMLMAIDDFNAAAKSLSTGFSLVSKQMHGERYRRKENVQFKHDGQETPMSAILLLDCFYEYTGISQKEQKDLNALLAELTSSGIHGTILIPETQVIANDGAPGFHIYDEEDLFLKLYVPENQFRQVVDVLGQDKFLFSSIHTEPSITDYFEDDLEHDGGLSYDF
jgi:hypothetical protein